MSEPSTRDQSGEGFVLARNSKPQNCGAVAQALRGTVDEGAWSDLPSYSLPQLIVDPSDQASHVSAEMII
jgi:hypothetical protein